MKPSTGSLRTALGTELRRLREEIVSSGIPLLTLNEIRDELRSQRRQLGESDE